MEAGELKVVEKTKQRCIYCGRKNDGIPPRVDTYTYKNAKFIITAPFCRGIPKSEQPPRKRGEPPPCCPQLTPAERQDPYIRDYHLRRPDPAEIDPGIRQAVLTCWDRDITTFMSCDGHGATAWISFWDLEDREQAIEVLAHLNPVRRDRVSRLLGPIYDMVFPFDVIEGSPRRKHDHSG